jgi:hypothetical protein
MHRCPCCFIFCLVHSLTNVASVVCFCCCSWHCCRCFACVCTAEVLSHSLAKLQEVVDSLHTDSWMFEVPLHTYH